MVPQKVNLRWQEQGGTCWLPNLHFCFDSSWNRKWLFKTCCPTQFVSFILYKALLWTYGHSNSYQFVIFFFSILRGWSYLLVIFSHFSNSWPLDMKLRHLSRTSTWPKNIVIFLFLFMICIISWFDLCLEGRFTIVVSNRGVSNDNPRKNTCWIHLLEIKQILKFVLYAKALCYANPWF
jgi:hypothetical protein